MSLYNTYIVKNNKAQERTKNMSATKFKKHIKTVRDYEKRLKRGDVTRSYIGLVSAEKDKILVEYFTEQLNDDQFDILYDKIESIRVEAVRIVYGD